MKGISKLVVLMAAVMGLVSCGGPMINMSQSLQNSANINSTSNQDSKYIFIIMQDDIQEVSPPHGFWSIGKFTINPYLHIKKALFEEYRSGITVYSIKDAPQFIEGRKIAIKTVSLYEVWKPHGLVTKSKYVADVNGQVVEGDYSKIIGNSTEKNMKIFLDKTFSDFASKVHQIYQ